MKARIRLGRAIASSLVVVLLLWCGGAFALDPSLQVSQYGHTAWLNRDGFGRSYPTAIAQTPDGYLWLGSEFGIFRFDGVRTVPWQPPGDGLPSQSIRTLLVTRRGTLWIGTYGGLARWDGSKLVVYPRFDGQLVDALLEDHEGTIWVAAQAPARGSSLCALRDAGTECTGEDGRFGEWISALLEDSKGRLWFVGSSGLWRWKPGPPERFALPDPPISLHGLVEDTDGALIIGTRGGVRKFIDGRIEAVPLTMPRPALLPRFMLRDRGGALWVSTDEGLLHFHQGRTDFFAQSDGLSGNSAGPLFQDREGNVWAVTADGLDRFRELAATSLPAGTALTGSTMASVLAARDGSIWISLSGGLNRLKDGRRTVYRELAGARAQASAPSAPPRRAAADVREISVGNGFSERAASLFEDSRGRVWLGTQAGIGFLQNDRYVGVEGIPGGYIDGFAEDRRGNVWVAHRKLGLLRLSPRLELRRFPWSELGRTDPATRVTLDASGDGLWLGFLLGGVVHFSGERVDASYGTPTTMDKGRVSDLHLDQDGSLWISTPTGLGRLKDGRLVTLTGRSGLPCDGVNWLVSGDRDTVWLRTVCGLMRVARAELAARADAVESGKLDDRPLSGRLFDDSDGVRGVGFSATYSSQAVVAGDERLWFVSTTGATVVDPRRLPHNPLPPPVHVERVIADRTPYEAGATSTLLRLPAHVRDLQIDYTATSLVAPERMQFRYRLEGLDETWRDAGRRRQAFYNDLPPGEYRFRVIASNNSGVWNETGAALDLSIAPAYFQTAWFRLLVVAAFAAALWAAYRWRVRVLATRLAAVQQENVERARTEEALRVSEQAMRRSEQALRESEERYALAVAGSNEGIFDWELATDRVYLAQHTQQLIGLVPGEPWRPRREWLALVTVHTDDAPGLREQIKAHLAGRTAAFDAAFRLVVQGRARWFNQRGIALRDAAGTAYRMVGSIGDIDERRREHDEMQKLEQRLRQAQRFEAMGALASGIAHDFNNILGAILGYGERAQRGAGKGTVLRRDLDQVLAASERGRALVETILAFSRGGAGERVSVHVEKVVVEALDLLQAKLPAGTTLSRSLHAGSAAFVGDPTQVHQIVMNLGTNAMHAMPRGGKLSVSLDVVRIPVPRSANVGTLEATEYLALKVADSGTGIAPDVLERIFDPFFTTKEAGAGTGLGLSLVLRIVTEAGGAIDVSSRVGMGSEFTIYLPRTGEAREDDGDSEPAPPRGNGQRVLVVDDEEPLLTLVTETLAELGYEPVGFVSSVAAFEAFRASPDSFDALIADNRMPGMTGLALIREVRGMRPSMPLLLVSGNVNAVAAAPADPGGPDVVLKKPVSMLELANCLARVLDSE